MHAKAPPPPLRHGVAGYLLLLILVLVPMQLAAQTPGERRGLPSEGFRSLERRVFEVADSLANAGALAEAYALLSEQLHEDRTDFEIRLASVQLALALGIVGKSHPLRLLWLGTAVEDASELEILRPDDPAGLAWAAAANGRLAQAEDGASTPARLAQEAWRLARQSIALDPNQPMGHYVMGELHDEAMRMSGWKRFLARRFLGVQVMGEASWEKADHHYLAAIAADPEMISFRLDLGDSYRDRGLVEAARSVYEDALVLREKLPVDRYFKAVLRERLQGLPGR